MARYIDADALISKLAYHRDGLDHNNVTAVSVLNNVIEIIECRPTISTDDVRGVGEWISKTMTVPGGHGQTFNRWGCSKCKAKFKTRTNYCPNCGARIEVSDDA